MPINPAQVKALISQGRIEEALEILNAHYPDATLLLNRLRTAQRERNLGIITFDEWTRTQAQISKAALDLLGSTAFPPPAPPAEPPTAPSASNPTPTPSAPTPPVAAPAVSPHIPWVLGLILLLGSAAALLVLAPSPTPNQEIVFRLLMALGAGGIATVLPGLFHIEMPNLKAGSAIGVFALVYLVNPAGAIKDDSRSEKNPFEFTIALIPDKQLRISPQYPKLTEATLKIRLANKWEPATVSTEGDADYKSIPGDFKDSTVAAQLGARYWKLQRDSVALKGKSAVLTILPDGSLGRVTGRVWESDGRTPIADALIELDELSARTDARGFFALEVPLEKQQARYLLRVSKSGLYERIQELVPYEGETLAFRLKKQSKRK